MTTPLRIETHTRDREGVFKPLLSETLMPSDSPSTSPPLNTPVTPKRRASDSFENIQQGNGRKRQREAMDELPLKSGVIENPTVDGNSLVEDLAQELRCGCCSALVYRPVVVSPCHHFFCGSCCLLWIRNGGTNCPACRGTSTSVTPSRTIQSMVDVLLRAAPWKERTIGEREQADNLYKANTTLRIPTPREASPDIGEYARPCPHCQQDNPYGWHCPQPIPDPDGEGAWRLDEGLPSGHAICGNCEDLHAVGAPSTTKCDLCHASFCGVNVHGRCLATPLASQQPHGMSDISDLIQSSEVYECFEQNAYEVEILLDYITSQRLTPRHIYREIITHIQSQREAFAPLIELNLFAEPGTDPNPDAPRDLICRLCAADVLLWGLREWWIRERQKGFLGENVLKRQDCSQGQQCDRQNDLAHAREFNHIILPHVEGQHVASVSAATSSAELEDRKSPAPGLVELHEAINH